MSDRWWNYFEKHKEQGRHWLDGAISHWQFFKTFYGMVFRYLPDGSKVLDIGCGPGYSDLYLSAHGYKVTGVDNDERIISLAEGVRDQIGASLGYQHGDAFDLSPFYGKFDMAYSVGVLEHFDREVTIQLLQEQARCAPLVLISIPTKYTCYSDGITDERIYTMSQLKQIVRDAGMDVVTGFGFGDVTATPLQIWVKRLLPHAVYRLLQNHGFAFNIAVIGRNSEISMNE
jgi:SAM-dependent methyltransferase